MENQLMMHMIAFFGIEPYLWLAFGGLVVLLSGLLKKGKRLSLWVSLFVLAGTMHAAFKLLGVSAVIENFVIINRLTQSAILFYCAIAITIILMSQSAAVMASKLNEIYYSLIIFSVLGMSLIPSNNLIAALIGIELVTICTVCLGLWLPKKTGSIDAITKYMVMAGVAAGFLVMGIACIYFGSGTLMLSELYQNFLQNTSGSLIFILLGVVLLLVGIGFELATVPFHTWLADFYEGAPAPIVAFVGSASKVAILVWLMMFPSLFFSSLWITIKIAFAILAVISMVIGTLLALLQQNIKRLLAYSSIAHMGFILLTLSLHQHDMVSVISYYTLNYSLALIAMFAIFSLIESADNTSVLSQNLLQGIGCRHPAVGMSICMIVLSLAGIPPLGGFFGKFFIFKSIVQSKQYVYAFIMALTSATALYYYIRIILIVFDRPNYYSEVISSEQNKRLPMLNSMIIFIATFLVVFLGIAAQSVLDYTTKLIA